MYECRWGQIWALIMIMMNKVNINMFFLNFQENGLIINLLGAWLLGYPVDIQFSLGNKGFKQTDWTIKTIYINIFAI